MSERGGRGPTRGTRSTATAGPASAPPAWRRWRPSALEVVVLVVLLLIGVNFLASTSRSAPDASTPVPVAAAAMEAAPPPPPAEEPVTAEVEPTSSFPRLQAVGGVLRGPDGAPIQD
jgi:hypothetical protein